MRFALMLFALLSSLTIIAHADTLDYKFSGVEEELCLVDGGAACVPSILEFTLSSNPVVSTNPAGSSPPVGGFFVAGPEITTLQNTTATISPSVDFTGITFYKDRFFIDQSIFFAFDSGFMTFSGDTSAPTLLTGTTNAHDYLDNSSYELTGGSLVITDLNATTTPEPSAIALVSTGLLGILGVVRRRLV